MTPPRYTYRISGLTQQVPSKWYAKKWKHPRKTPSMIKVKSKNLVRKNTVTHSPVRAGRNENKLVRANKSL